MPGPTYTADLATWIPDVIATSIYDQQFESDNTLVSLAGTYDELNGKAGDSFDIPTLEVTAPADNLAENVAAVDDKISGGVVTVTIKEGVKSISWSDRTRIQTGKDVNQIAGQRVGNGMLDRVELDLGAALLAGRNIAADTAGALDVAAFRAMKRKLPAKMRKRGLVLVGVADVLDNLLDDPLVLNAATFGSDEAIREGAFSRPLAGVTPMQVDDGVLPDVTIGGVTGPAVVLMARGMLIRAFQKTPSAETERDARARVTRIVGTMLHGEGVLDSRGVVVRRVA